MPTFRDYLAQVRSQISETTPREVEERRRHEPPPRVIDVREVDEWEAGHVPGAVHLPRAFLESRVEGVVSDRDAELIVYCAGGTRSALAVRALAELGYTRVSSMAGGFSAWKEEGLPFEQPRVLRPEQLARYGRHTLLPEVGMAGQLAMLEARVACVGAGGLGSPALLYLAAAGIGHITVIDDDAVDASNLQRQVIHSTDRVGAAKVESAAAAIARLNPDVRVRGVAARLTVDNADEILAGHDVIIDGTDNFTARYLIGDAGLRLGIPVVHASIYRFEGQLAVFGAHGRPCYRCLFAEPPPPEAAPSCAEAGVLGVLPGIMGLLQATEALKIVLGIGEPLVGRLLVFDALRTELRQLRLRADPACPSCGTGQSG